jgi:hypothetical protein
VRLAFTGWAYFVVDCRLGQPFFLWFFGGGKGIRLKSRVMRHDVSRSLILEIGRMWVLSTKTLPTITGAGPCPTAAMPAAGIDRLTAINLRHITPRLLQMLGWLQVEHYSQR